MARKDLIDELEELEAQIDELIRFAPVESGELPKLAHNVAVARFQAIVAAGLAVAKRRGSSESQLQLLEMIILLVDHVLEQSVAKSKRRLERPKK